MKKSYCILTVLTLICLVFTSSCATETEGAYSPNGLMEGASPGTSALTLDICDGKETQRYHLFDTAQINTILGLLDQVKVKEAADWSCDDIEFPIYGLSIGDTEGWTIEVAWSDGYWITSEGTAYYFDFDFASLKEDYDWELSNSFASTAILPCAWWLMNDDGTWCTAAMTPAADPTAPEGIEMKLLSWEEGVVTVSYINNTDSEWSYGESYGLHVLLDGQWYSVPSVPGNWGFTSIANILMPGAEQEKSYTLSYMYAGLPAGTYRLSANGLVVEGAIE